jgi:RimJ/RimL family protein N-acetyltransferase
MFAPTLTDGVITLRMMTLDDAEDHIKNEDELTIRYLSESQSDLESTRGWIEKNRLSWEEGGFVRCFGIQENSSGDLVGMIEANSSAPGYKAGVVANISYGVRSFVRGKGYVPRAVNLISEYLAGETNIAVAVIQFDPENHPSERVAQKSGFKHLGERTDSNGKRMIVYGLRLKPNERELTISDVSIINN